MVKDFITGANSSNEPDHIEDFLNQEMLLFQPIFSPKVKTATTKQLLITIYIGMVRIKSGKINRVGTLQRNYYL